MVSKVCSRSQGHPPGARSRAMIETTRSNRSPVIAIRPTLNEAVAFCYGGLVRVKRLIQKLRIIGDDAVDAPLGELAHAGWIVHRPGHDLQAPGMGFVNERRRQKIVTRQQDADGQHSPYGRRLVSIK